MDALTVKSFELRQDALDMVYHAKTGHLGGDFSVMDILVTLYFKHMNISPKIADNPSRDLFVLSKGHAVEAYYAVLAERGFFSKAELMRTYAAFNSPFIGHPNNKLPGIEMNTGSLGHGLPVCVGMALASRADHNNRRIYTVLGDGELAEGSVWEGFMAGSHFKLANLCAVIDRNRLQISGSTGQVMAHDDLAARIGAFGWHVLTVNGNDVNALDKAFTQAKLEKGKPTAIIANTIKGFGGGELMENQVAWHHKVPSDAEYMQIKQALKQHLEVAAHE